MVELLSQSSHLSSIFSSKRKGKGKLSWLIVIGSITLFAAYFLYGLNQLVQGKPLLGVGILTSFMFVLWFTVQVITL